jgi:hypothetical protein
MFASFLACYLSSSKSIKVANILDKNIEKTGKIAPLIPAIRTAKAKAHIDPFA